MTSKNFRKGGRKGFTLIELLIVNPPTIARYVIPRHAWAAPSTAPQNFDITQRLPGGINIGLLDGHAELSKLENLWNYNWHLNYKPPLKRPGLL